jgi:membrane associated rhomboid family serine protease
MNRITDTVKHLIGINVVLFIATNLLIPNLLLNLAVYYPGSPSFQPYQIATHMFMHASVPHLFFNMLTLYFFGPSLESRWGYKKFLIYYLICGIGGFLLHVFILYLRIRFGDETGAYIPMLGASGAIFGLMVGFAYYFPDTEMFLMFFPFPVKAKYMVMILAGVDLFMGVGNFGDNIARFAHLGGALAGLIMLFFFGSYFSGGKGKWYN